MINFKKETLKAIQESGHLEEDVMFIGSKDWKYRISIEEFKKISDFTYDDGFWSQEIPSDLIIYFKDKSYIARWEYDGSEWWEYNKVLSFSDSDESQSFDRIPLELWYTLEESLNKVYH